MSVYSNSSNMIITISNGYSCSSLAKSSISAQCLGIFFTTLPCTSCSAERLFRCLRRIKTYLRTTMLEESLNHVSGINIHKQEMAKINRQALLDEFVSRN